MSFLRYLPPAGPAREDFLLAAVRAGALDAPTWVEICVGGVPLRVSADYLTICGERVPMAAHVAQAAVDSLDAHLPTPAVVDAIEERATIISLPTWEPGPGQEWTEEWMASPEVLGLAEDRTREAFAAAAVSSAELVAGHRKDVVLARRMPPGRVVIYGGRDAGGGRVQPLFSGHLAGWADYSHGVRAVRYPAGTLDGHRSDLLGGPVEALRYPARAS